jgi:hypothetical protein
LAGAHRGLSPWVGAFHRIQTDSPAAIERVESQAFSNVLVGVPGITFSEKVVNFQGKLPTLNTGTGAAVQAAPADPANELNQGLLVIYRFLYWHHYLHNHNE